MNNNNNNNNNNYSEYIAHLVHWKYFPIVVIVIVCSLGWCITNCCKQTHMSAQFLVMSNKNSIINSNTNSNNIMPDERLFRNTIDLPDRDPRWLTTSMVAPQVSIPSDEKRKGSRMEVFNMFYNNGIDDEIAIKSRPRSLYVIP